MTQKEVVKLELLEIQQDAGANGFDDVRLRTNDGIISCRYRSTEDAGSAVLCVPGARGIYERLADQLVFDSIASLLLDYRRPGRLIDCVFDVLLGIGFLRNQGHGRVTLAGHGFGGAVVI